MKVNGLWTIGRGGEDMTPAESGRFTTTLTRRAVAVAGLLALHLLAGCSMMQGPEGESPAPSEHASGTARQTESDQRADVKPAAEKSAKAIRPKPTPKPTVVEPPPPKRVAIVYSDGVPVYRRIAARLADRLGERARAVALQGPHELRVRVKAADYDLWVAIGVLAAGSVAELTDKPLVYCQIFNYAEHGLTAPHMQGVSMLPPAALQLGAWKHVAPNTRRLGVLTGPGHEGWIEQARLAAQPHRIELVHRVVHSDKEALYEFKRLVPSIDSLWLLPDERILSRRVLHQVMTYSAKHERLVLGFTPKLLQLGALMSAQSMESDVVSRIEQALALEAESEASFQMLPLTKAQITVNPEVARRIGRRQHVPAAWLDEIGVR